MWPLSESRFADSNGSLIISDSLFVNSKTDDKGGAILVTTYDRLLFVFSSYFENCSSPVNGGAIFAICKEMQYQSLVFVKCFAYDEPSIASYDYTNKYNSVLLYCAILFCLGHKNNSCILTLEENVKCNYINNTRCFSRHIALCFLGSSSANQEMTYSTLINNTTDEALYYTQLQNPGKVKVSHVNYVGSEYEDASKTIIPIRLVNSCNLKLSSCYFMKSFSSIFISNNNINPTVSASNCYRLNNIPIGIDGIDIKLDSKVQTADAEFDVQFKFIKWNISFRRNRNGKHKCVVSLFLSSLLFL